MILKTCVGSSLAGILVLLFGASCLALGSTQNGHVQFSVTDEEGIPVPDAEATVYFVKDDALLSIKPRRGLTDEHGLFAAEGRSNGEAIFHFRHEGCYPTRGRIWFRRQNAPPDGGGWALDELYGQNFWPPTEMPDGTWKMQCHVVMKRVRQPHPMSALNVDRQPIPPDGSPGFDLVEGDWVAPDGKGKTEDIRFIWNDGYPVLSFGTPESGNGCLCLEKDFWSDRGQLQVAPEDGYMAELDLGESPGTRNGLATGAEYLIVRCRVQRDGNGNVASARYGLLTRLQCTGAWHAPGAIRIAFAGWMNPRDNELNLENE